MGQGKRLDGDPVSAGRVPTATVALVAADLLQAIAPLDPGGDFMRARESFEYFKEKGQSTVPYEFHRYVMRQAVSLAWELVEMVEEQRPEGM